MPWLANGRAQRLHYRGVAAAVADDREAIAPRRINKRLPERRILLSQFMSRVLQPFRGDVAVSLIRSGQSSRVMRVRNSGLSSAAIVRRCRLSSCVRSCS